MPEIPVLAYYYNKREEELIRKYMRAPVITESFIYGYLETDNISLLKKEGILIDLQGDPHAVHPLHSEIPRSVQSKSIGKRFVSLGSERSGNSLKTNYYLIRLKGPMFFEWQERLDAEKIKITERLQNNVYMVYTTLGVAELQSLDFVLSARPCDSYDTDVVLKRSLLAGFDLFEPETERVAIYDIKLEDETENGIQDFLEARNVDILAADRNKIRARITGTKLLHELRQLNEVYAIEEFVRPVLHIDKARLIINIDREDNGSRRANVPYEGDGQLVGVADTGIDSGHPDFDGRIYKIVAKGRMNDHSDPVGHGTHVAGSIVGNGKASQGVVKGIAPKSKLFFQSILDEEGGLGGIPLNLGDLFQEAYDEGVRIHNNSWGAFAESEYLFNSLEVDEFVHSHRDMLIVISAGNEGSAFQPRNSRSGFVDWLSLGTPATAKNALTVGACRSIRQEGGFSTMTHGQAWPDVFPEDPVRGEKISGNADCMAGFSSRGPCGNESRIKPDVVAPGSDIASARSSSAPGSNFWGPYPGNRMYAFMGGTSMSAPIVAAFAALIREYFLNEKSYSPSASLLKAAIVNSTRMLKGDDALADHAVIPNFHQGFGCIDMINALPNSRLEDLALDFIDSWQKSELQFHATGQRFLFRLDVEEGLPLRLCLTWTDPPGRGLQNNLNLFLMHTGKQFKWTGNEDLPRTITAFDRDNNVEIIRIEDPIAGVYMIAVQAANIIFAPQDFSLVVTGNLMSDLQKQ